MSKFYGAIGFCVDQNEVRPGVFQDVIEERYYYGDVLHNKYQNGSGEGLNDDITLTNDFSIIADEYAIRHCHIIKHITWHGIKWKVKSVNLDNLPRLILSIGGVYHEQEPSGFTYSFGEH